MALQVAISDSIVGVPFAEAYANIQFARMTKSDAMIFVNWYANAAARWANKAPVLQKEYHAPMSALTSAPYETMYEWLKLHPDFVGAQDVLNDPQPQAVAAPIVAPVVEDSGGSGGDVEVV
jgi:hypothetical protein